MTNLNDLLDNQFSDGLSQDRRLKLVERIGKAIDYLVETSLPTPERSESSKEFVMTSEQALSWIKTLYILTPHSEAIKQAASKTELRDPVGLLKLIVKGFVEQGRVAVIPVEAIDDNIGISSHRLEVFVTYLQRLLQWYSFVSKDKTTTSHKEEWASLKTQLVLEQDGDNLYILVESKKDLFPTQAELDQWQSFNMPGKTWADFATAVKYEFIVYFKKLGIAAVAVDDSEYEKYDFTTRSSFAKSDILIAESTTHDMTFTDKGVVEHRIKDVQHNFGLLGGIVYKILDYVDFDKFVDERGTSISDKKPFREFIEMLVQYHLQPFVRQSGRRMEISKISTQEFNAITFEEGNKRNEYRQRCLELLLEAVDGDPDAASEVIDIFKEYLYITAKICDRMLFPVAADSGSNIIKNVVAHSLYFIDFYLNKLIIEISEDIDSSKSSKEA